MNKFLLIALSLFAFFPDWPNYASAHAQALAEFVQGTQSALNGAMKN
ncbi:MAG: hypothetical protein R3194_12220 [Limnobacter sp.]|nr:hypothetical protein [Limnobacter sp.]